MTTKHTSATPAGVVSKETEMFRVRDAMRQARDAIAAILAARKAPPGCVIDENGVVRKVPDDHPRSADGSPVFIGDLVWGYNINGDLKAYHVSGVLDVPSMTVQLKHCWTTREAAEAAKDVK